ncbi:MAG: molecular chaperone DnaJ [Clostridia bacterium]
MKDYYKTLGVEKNASQDDIKSAYRKLAKQLHPDVNKSPDAPAKFKEINEAYQCLGDESKRANYDNYGSADGPQGFNFGGAESGGFNFGGGGFTDMFSDLFSAFGGGGQQRHTVEKGDDINVAITITLEESAFGVTKNLLINRYESCDKCSGTGAKNGTAYSTCPDCNGLGRIRVTQQTMFGTTIREGACKNCNATGKIIREKCDLCGGKGSSRKTSTIAVKVPGGIADGQILKMAGQGNAPVRQGVNGDLFIKISVAPHKVLVRQDSDILLDLFVPFTTSLLGGKVIIPTLEGDYELQIKELTQSGTVMRLKNKGTKVLNREYRGDMLVTIKAEPPRTLDKKTKDLLKQIEIQNPLSSYAKSCKFEK